ncbi:MAG: response regulator [Spirochaetes bacterium]|nr:response regulator [Spirochaetota bacterium]
MSQRAEIGAFLRAIREERGITLREAEALSGISNSYLNQIETGKVSKPSPKILRKLSNLYHISYDLLLEKCGYELPDILLDPAEKLPKAIVLIIDDNGFDRALIRTMLEKDSEMSYEVIEAENGSEAIKKSEKYPPDVVLLDYRLGTEDGLEVLNVLKKNIILRNVPVIMLTGYGNEELAVKALKMGAVNYFNKDYIKPENFFSAIKNAIGKKRILESIAFHKKSNNDASEQCEAIAFSVATIIEAAARLVEEYPSIAFSDEYATILREARHIMGILAKNS